MQLSVGCRLGDRNTMSSRKRRRESDAPVPAPAAAESDERVCWVCLEPHVRATRSGARELARCGCACRGSGAGWAHLPCLIRAAQHQPAMWDECPTCKHEYSGSMMLNLARTRARLAEEAFDAAPLEAMWITREGRPVVTREHETEEELSASMSMLANVLIGRGGYAEARRILERLVARDAERWGADDSVTLHSQCGLVQALLDMGDFAAARPKADQLVATCVERLGSTDGTTLDAQAVRAQVLEMVGEEAQARRLWEEIVATRLAQDGPTGEETVVAKHMHADMLHSCGHAAAARALYEEVLAAYTQTVGPAHEDTLNLEGTLAELQVALGLDLPAAEQTLRRCVCTEFLQNPCTSVVLIAFNRRSCPGSLKV